MKLKNNKFGIYGWKSLCFLLVATTFWVACEEDSDLKLPLAVNSNQLNLGASGGSTQIMVYSTGRWSVSFDEAIDWGSIDKLEGEGNSSVVFSFSQNLGASRRVTLILDNGGEQQKIVIIQAGIDPSLSFAFSSYELPKSMSPVSLELVNNLKYNMKDIEIEYRYDDEVSEKWVSDVKILQDAFEFTALENNLGDDRLVKIFLSFTDGNNKITSTKTILKQTSSLPFLNQDREETKTTKMASIQEVILSGNVLESTAYFEKEIEYVDGAGGWISNLNLVRGLLTFDMGHNETGQDRSAVIHLKLKNQNGQELVSLSHTVKQTAYAFENYTFEQLRALIPGATGEYLFDDPLKGLEGIVISDAGNPNMETNPNKAYNSIDFTENEKTAYIQALDGSFGLMIKTSAPEDNLLARYSKVSIILKGMTLVKESNPERYTLKGFTPDCLVSSTAGTSADIAAKQKYINELTDADIYTFVQLKDVEISLPYGSYVNVNPGYILKTDWNTVGAKNPYLDAVPTTIRDTQGGHAKLLTNAKAPWCRNILPEGFGTISGIVVHSKLKKYGAGEGDIGPYAIRVLEESAIDLNLAAKSRILVEWNWIGATACEASVVNKDADGNVLPAIGTGKLSCTNTSAKTGLSVHPICHTDHTSKTSPSSAMYYTNAWWNASTGEGGAFVFHFSTAGINGRNLTVNFSQGGGSGNATTLHVPVYWQVEYATDGVNYTVLPGSTYCVRPLTGWGLTHLFTCPGLNNCSFTLPDNLFDEADVYVRLSVQNNICGANTPDGGEGGRITTTENTGNVNVRIGVVSFRYIQ